LILKLFKSAFFPEPIRRDELAQAEESFKIGLRFDSYFSGVEINSIPDNKENVEQVARAKVKGRLFIKEFPTKSATVQTVRSYIQRLQAIPVMVAPVYTAYDVGAAGIHRLFPAIRKCINAHVFIVAAGREGTLPSVVAGLVDRPVIGVPVSTGYGYMGQGKAALASMLQSCSVLAVVNIDAGFNLLIRPVMYGAYHEILVANKASAPL
jgi:hypothetical protein